MPKPTTKPRWGTDQTNETVPPSLVQDSGHPLSSPYVSSYANWRARLTYEWINWFDQGELTEKIPMTSGRVRDDATNTDVAVEWTEEWSPLLVVATHEIAFEIPAQVGRKIKDVTARVVPSTSGDIVKLTILHNGVNVGESTTSGATLQTLAVNDINVEVTETSKTVAVIGFDTFDTGVEVYTINFSHHAEPVS